MLFKNYDIEVSDTLDYNEMKILITDLLDIALIILPKFALLRTAEAKERKKLKKYCKKLQKSQEILFMYFEGLLIKNKEIDIPIDEFVKMFDNFRISELVSSQKIRLRGLEQRFKSKIINPSPS